MGGEDENKIREREREERGREERRREREIGKEGARK